jgi:lipid-binding SYLF domain-containing protein
MKKMTVMVCASVLMATQAFAATPKSKLVERLNDSKTILNEIMATPDSSIPNSILSDATCVAVIPGYKKAAFIFGGQYGQGVVTCRTGHGWSAPVFIQMAGGSFGLQIGGQSTDLVLIAVNKKGFQDLLKSKFKVGADASAAAGPVGRNAEAATNLTMHSELLTYSRNRGIFAGVDLGGTTVSQNTDDTRTYYGTKIPFETILKGETPTPASARPFVSTVAKYFVQSKKK